jgi:hypothetical protein
LILFTLEQDMPLPPNLGREALEYLSSLDTRSLLPNDKTLLLDTGYGSPDIQNLTPKAAESQVSRLRFALKHAVEVLEELAQRACPIHDGNDETGEHYDDCIRCKVEAVLAHTEEVMRT